MLASMSFLEWVAWSCIDAAVLGILVACDFDKDFRERLLFEARSTPGALLWASQQPLGWGMGIGARMLSPVSRRASQYAAIRSHKPKHHNSFWQR